MKEVRIEKGVLFRILDEYKSFLHEKKVKTGKMKERTLASNISIIKNWVNSIKDKEVVFSVADELILRYPPKYHKDKIKNFIKFVCEKLQYKAKSEKAEVKSKEENLPKKEEREIETDIDIDIDVDSDIIIDVSSNFSDVPLSLNSLLGKPVTVKLLTGASLKGEIVKIVEGKESLIAVKMAFQNSSAVGKNPRLGARNVQVVQTVKIIPVSAIESITVLSDLFQF